MDGIFKSINISASGMSAERFRLNVISQNLANSDTTRTENGEPYRRKIVTFEEVLNGEKGKRKNDFGGVKVSSIEEDTTPFKLVYNPDHPDSNEEGYVRMPNVNVLKEMVDMMTAQRAYDLNAAVINSAKSMYNSALNIGK
ncbi:flagellar basal body rod protein FlgC [Geotoga petraea]|jgi:flagellar basal-body rod protein FlgC|uniref:Flagellar basal-body rod protein FlgC n=1 Tax=Geotoga petraea TaxID=28234 RepID=A0A1G6IIK7_9BACT|nr:flagellar basal body rod protein FlgC [Geotoga petraea]MDK2945268.1 flagellar basal-body rod protein FlgC [Geotoga sp.]TGG89214.1 flagellar basal body rod protein FlgC [Geotoga petraea]SDC06357.1 flagellar basal-body rod protein FlgC [Geotoga petraea]